MKKQKAKLKKGDIVVNHNEWRRMIRDIEYQDGKVCYSYYNELLDEGYKPTGLFNQFSIGFCSQDHLLRWGKLDK